MQSETGFTTLSAMREITRDVMETVALPKMGDHGKCSAE